MAARRTDRRQREIREFLGRFEREEVEQALIAAGFLIPEGALTVGLQFHYEKSWSQIESIEWSGAGTWVQRGQWWHLERGTSKLVIRFASGRKQTHDFTACDWYRDTGTRIEIYSQSPARVA